MSANDIRFDGREMVIDVTVAAARHTQQGKGFVFALRLSPHSDAGKSHGQFSQLLLDGSTGPTRDGHYFPTPEAAAEWLNGLLEKCISQQPGCTVSVR